MGALSDDTSEDGRYLLLFRVEFNPRRIEPVGVAPIAGEGDLFIRLALHRIKPDLLGDEVDQILGVYEAEVSVELRGVA